MVSIYLNIAIRFSHPSIPEEAIFTANSQAGPVAILNGDMGLFQNVQTQSQPLEFLTAVVRDKALNPLSGVAVEFFVKTGQAYFAPGEGVMIAAMNGKTGQKITLKTDKNGLVAVRPYIGEEEGLVEIQAKLATIAVIGGSANTSSPVLADVIYKLQAKAAKDGPTGFSGRVFDDKGLPIAGVTLSIARTLNSTTTDAKGQFNFNDIPAGRIDLFVDGRTVNPNLDSAKPQYPSLHFEAYAVQGQANSLTHPIYMPPLLITPQSAKLVGAQDTTLTLPNLAGFSMFIKKGSVTFPDGSKTGQLIVSPVTADRLPMSPPSGGAIFGLPAWTIQPAGTRFDPPIEVRMPNNTALPPGSRTPVIQWDHDLGQYTAMGYATVSEDGSQLITEAGSGISKAGWGAACVYSPGACANCLPEPCRIPPPVCGECEKLAYGFNDTCPTCKADSAKNGQQCESLQGGYCGRCKDGKCPPNIFVQFPAKAANHECCGGKIIDLNKKCCIKSQNSLVGTFKRAADRGKPLIAQNPPIDFSKVSRFDLIQYSGPPPPSKEWQPEWKKVVNNITYEVDGCSVPKFLQPTFPPGLFKQSHEIDRPGVSPMAIGFYEGCKKHDFCYQTCGSVQETCDTNLKNNLFGYCATIKEDEEGTGFYDVDLQNPVKPKNSLKTECVISATKVWLGLATGGFPAHNARQNQMCMVCQ